MGAVFTGIDQFIEQALQLLFPEDLDSKVISDSVQTYIQGLLAQAKSSAPPVLVASPSGEITSSQSFLPQAFVPLSAPTQRFYQGNLIPGGLPTLVTAAALDPTGGFIYPPSDKSFQYQVLTPGSDPVWAGFSEFQVIFGRRGNNVYYGYDHSLNPTQTPVAIDIMLAKTDPVPLFILVSLLNTAGGSPPEAEKDRFVLGDWRKSYYSNKLGGKGYNDFAYILNFNPNSDTIQLHGAPTDYLFVSIPLLGMAIFDMSDTTSTDPFEGDLVGLVFGNTTLTPNSPQISYTGNTPPPITPLFRAQQFGSGGLDVAATTNTDLWGNVYTAGLTNGSLFGPAQGDYDNWIVKFNSSGERLWEKQFGTNKSDQILKLVTDKVGNFYVVGSTQGDLASPLESDLQDAYVAKYDANGTLLWQKQFGSAFLNGSASVSLDPDGNLYMAGITLTGDKRPRPDVIIDAQDDFWVTKFNPDGDQIWFTQVGTPLDSPAIWDEIYGVAVSKQLDNPADPLSRPIYATGWTYGGLDGPNRGLGSYDGWITKFNGDGTVAWIRQFGSPNPPTTETDLDNYEFSWSVDTDSQGNAYVFGWTQGNLVRPVEGLSDLFILKYDAAGNEVWRKQFGTVNDDGAFLGSLVIDNQDRLFVAGYTNGSFKPGKENLGQYDAWVASFDTDGNQLWVQQHGTPQLDYATKLSVDNLGHVYLTGYTEGSLGTPNAGALDAWVLKLNADQGWTYNFNPEQREKRQILTGNNGNNRLVAPTPLPGETNIVNFQLQGLGGKDTLLGGVGEDLLEGGNNSDILRGGQGEDILVGGLQRDFLVGGLQNDLFVFGSEPGYDISQDLRNRILDFQEIDKIGLSKSGFANLQSTLGDGFNVTTEFTVVTQASQVSRNQALIVYNSTTGELIYNADGVISGLGGGGVFAVLNNQPTLTAANFRIVS